MSFFFDTRSALAKIEKQDCTPATSATPATQDPKTTPHVAGVADVAAPKSQSEFFQKGATSHGAGPKPAAIQEFSDAVKEIGRSEFLDAVKGDGQPEFSDAVKQSGEEHPYGRSVTGNPKTWTGKVVSLEQWRQLSEWEKHGSTGRHFNGKTQQWEMPS